MDTESLTQQISTRFVDIASDAQLVAECVSVCKNYGFTPEELQYKWEAHNFSHSATRSEISPYTPDSFASLKLLIQRERATKTAVQKAPPRTAPVTTINRGAFRNRNPANRPVNGAAQIKVESDADGFAMVAGPSTVSFQGPSTDAAAFKKRAYRYMLEKPSERGDVLDDRIDEFAERIRECYDLPELGDPSSPTEGDITVVGRMVHDGDAAEDAWKLADEAIALECSRALGNGARVPLRFESAMNLKVRRCPQGSGGAAFFPGALVALRGRNGGGGYFQVSEVLTLPPAPPSVVKSEADASFSMFIASGPFTPDQDLGFKPWRALLKKIQEAKPAVVLLLGPFIDVLHPLIKCGDVDSTPLNLFRTRFTDPLRAYLDSVPGSIAIFVPSVRDLISNHAVFPQRELAEDVARADPRIHLVPNPAWFTLNGIAFAATSEDVLYHLNKGEFVKRGEEIDATAPMSPEDAGNDRMAGLCRHLLQQRSFYPVFPVPAELTAELVLDVSHSDGLRLGTGDGDAPECAPDVLIVPSRLKQFAKTVYATSALNPSFVSKGTYIILDVSTRDAGATKARLAPRLEKLQ